MMNYLILLITYIWLIMDVIKGSTIDYQSSLLNDTSLSENIYKLYNTLARNTPVPEEQMTEIWNRSTTLNFFITCKFTHLVANFPYDSRIDLTFIKSIWIRKFCMHPDW